jgi:hypothetical protein
LSKTAFGRRHFGQGKQALFDVKMRRTEVRPIDLFDAQHGRQLGQEAPPGSSIGVGHYMHGQVCRVPQDATPLLRVAGQFTYFINGSWYEANNAEASMAWVDHSWTAMKRHSSKGTYINYLSTNDAAAVKASYGQNFARLVELKRKYGPANFFHHNRNIRLPQ